MLWITSKAIWNRIVQNHFLKMNKIISKDLRDLKVLVCKNKHDEKIFDIAFRVIHKREATLNKDDLDSAVDKYRLLLHIKDTVFRLIQNYIKDPDHLLIIRWFYTQKLLDPHPDPILPYNDHTNEGIRYELVKNKVPTVVIPSIENLLHQMVISYKQFGVSVIKTKILNKSVNVAQNNGYTTLLYSNIFFKILTKSYFRLIQNFKSADLNDDVTSKIFILLCRYQSLYAPGYHAAIPIKVFDVLQKELKVTHEIFASPFNRILDNYTSAYPDIDGYFGSKGNFFEVFPKLFEHGGSFEANPPFLEEHMATFALIVIDNLRRQVPLSFVVIVPAWIDTVLYHLFVQTEYNIFSGVLSGVLLSQTDHSRSDPKRTNLAQELKGQITRVLLAQEPKEQINMNKYLEFQRHQHYYRNGADYLHIEDVRKSSNKTLIFILQNDLGRKEYPVTQDFINKITKAFTEN